MFTEQILIGGYSYFLLKISVPFFKKQVKLICLQIVEENLRE